MWLVVLLPIGLGMLVAMPVTIFLFALVSLAYKVGGTRIGSSVWFLISAALVVLPFLAWDWLLSRGPYDPETGPIGPFYVGDILPLIVIGLCAFSFVFLLVAMIESRRRNKKLLQRHKEGLA
jgi:hypothetical protein